MAGSVVVTLVTGEKVEGTLFCVDPVTKALVVEHEGPRYTLVNAAHISSVDGDLSAPSPNTAAMGASTSNLEKREDVALRQAERKLTNINNNVTPTEQQLFDRMARVLGSTTWSGNVIVVLDNIIIEPPYAVAVINGGDNSQLAFVQKLLTGERKKLGLE